MSEIAPGGGRAEVHAQLFRTLEDRSRDLEEEIRTLNERLRAKVDDLHVDLTKAESALTTAYEETRRDRDRLRRKTEELELENREFAQRFVELQDHSSSLTNLYAATFQLHSSLEPDAVVRTIEEIAVNLIGAAEFVLYLADDSKRGFVVAASEGGMVPQVGSRAELSHPIEMAAVDARRTVFVERIAREREQAPQPICCAPFYFRDQMVGALSIYTLLSHKTAFSQVDRELFDMLGEQAALAIVSAQAFVTVERKLKTVQRFMDLLRA